MENRADLKSILPLLPLSFNSSTLSWPSPVIEALKSISKGPDHSRVHSGEVLFLAISDINSSLYDNDFFLDPYASQGYSLFFDKLMENEQSAKWFTEVVPKMAEGLLRLPDLLVTHYKEADGLLGGGVSTGLRILGSQEPGIMFLTQELVGILLTCSFFCLFPSRIRGANLQAINFDKLFAYLYDCYSESLENKVKCIVHYFERIYSCMPTGLVSYERKVLLLDPRPSRLSYPGDDFWRKSAVPLCHFQVCSSGLIEDQSTDSLEVDFANKYLGGGALRRGCVQEEIRFMINPELIAGMLFLPCMAENEAIEIVGTERFSNYTGYAASFRFSGDHMDRKEFDPLKRRKTRIVAIDALCHPGGRQFEPDFILREINKAFCGFFNQMEYEKFLRLLQDRVIPTMEHGLDAEIFIASGTNHLLHVGYSVKQNEGTSTEQLTNSEYEEDIGIVTGNWGCGAFGGDPELKTIIQWLAASQALRPFITYCTFGLQALDNLDQVTQWIFSHKWTVGDLWVMLAEYSSQRLKGETRLGFFVWLLPSISAFDGEDTKMLVIP